MIDESIGKILEDAAKRVKSQKAPKPQPICGTYRNRLYYNNIFKNMEMDEAYDVVVKNLKKKTFAHEPECALLEYELKFGTFQSREERKQIAIEVENEALRKKIAELEAAKPPVPPVTDSEDKAIDVEDFPKGMDREAHKAFFIPWYTKSQGNAPDPMTIGRAFKKYNKGNEVQVQ